MPKKKITKKWLSAEMDRRVKQMLNLIDQDADSFAKKAEMYYQKRPELVAHVEEFYRLYRTLVERNDYLKGELRRNVLLDVQSQGSGVSDNGFELPPTCPSPEQRLTRRRSGARAAGFEFFLGSSWSDMYQRGDDESSYVTDSEPESDDGSVNNYMVSSTTNLGDQGAGRKTIELEIELRETKEKLQILEDESELLARIRKYEEELKIVNRKLRLSEEKNNWLTIELQKYKQMETSESDSSEEDSVKTDTSMVQNKVDKETLHDDGKILPLEDEFNLTKEMPQDPEAEIACLKLENKQAFEKIQSLQGQLDMAQSEIRTSNTKLSILKKEVCKLQGRMAMLKDGLVSRDNEIRELKIVVSDAEMKIFNEKAQIGAKVSKLLEERSYLEEQLRDGESHARSLEEEIRNVLTEKRELEERLHDEIEALKTEIAKRGDSIKILNENLETLKSERDELKMKIDLLEEEVGYKGDQIVEMDKQLHRLRVEHGELIASAEGANKLVEEMQGKGKELEDEIERQSRAIEEAAEEKREAIRQLCFSLEHYRDGYYKLKQAFTGNKRVPILAT
ncbi:hypothetical protein ES319_D13G272000v1 [Gossypium barbadense]|uniref:NAB domain-containing protein n=2 Tax=Gossypium TaxID=3633 RepID=A0A5J5NRT2_GOSBA|nr:hypothetical protein ES319_D13G272000v1 [Gossypium barbadense]KAB1997016.1 hypothetical protein ES319_D13G272000v1 [Gossypium barbadense]TYG39196.1 hypothetical protein ES288_D13G285300v1 [Gossypium darwinii]